MLEEKKKDEYNRYNKIMMNGSEDVFDNVHILYMAYLCGLDDVESAMSVDDFVDLLPPFPNVINMTALNLIRPKKQEASEKPSEAKDRESEEK